MRLPQQALILHWNDFPNSNNTSYCCTFFVVHICSPIVCVHPKYSSVQLDYMCAYHFRPFRFLFAFFEAILYACFHFTVQQRAAETLFSIFFITTTFHGMLFSCIMFPLNQFFLFEINSNGNADDFFVMVYECESLINLTLNTTRNYFTVCNPPLSPWFQDFNFCSNKLKDITHE